MTRSEEVIYLARKFLFVREVGGPNKGIWVEGIQKLAGGVAGESWCCYFVSVVLALAFGGFTKSPIGRTGVCQDVYALAKKNGWLRDRPVQIGDMFLYVDANDHAHHIGLVCDDAPLIGIAGNTSEDGSKSNGDGVYEHGISAHTFVHWPRGE
jgi:hypothetical protein